MTPSISVSDVETDNRNIVLPSASIDGDGWLVLHPEAEGGGPNAKVTLAQKQLTAGEYSDIELTMTTILAGEQTVYAMLHYDDPADGEFTFPANGDPPVTKDGSPVIKPFKVTLTGEVTPSISVSDVETDNRNIVLPSASIDGDGWLVLHPEAEGGGPNAKVTLAQKQLSAGEYSDVALAMDTLLTGEQTVYAMLHYDDPADGEFTFPANGDPPVTKDGSPVIKPFKITLTGEVTPSLSVTDQETSGGSVTVPSTAIDQTGWLVIHPEADGGGPNGGVTLATRQLQPGRYADVTLQLDDAITESQTVYAMLHYDDPADDEFTFPANGDPPITKDGSPIVKPFEVTVGSGETSMQTVELVNTAFDPVRASVAPGTTVEWVNQDSYGHDVTSAQFHDVAEQWDFSKSLSSSDTAMYTFDSEGIYEYRCTVHGKDTMCGVVLVGDVSLDKDLPCEGGGGGY